ncbi:hypothetical protein GALL_88400 [mine drainage metagenome]|uniref:Uncharacterized protein n=1 Tax=mine drainage metagenome TaxID=410659 RepID=A0A1J5SK86_9ZZZZ
MKDSIDNLMRQFTYDDKRIIHLLGMFDDCVRFIRDYDDQFDLGSTEHEKSMLAGYRNSAFGILLSLLQLGHITTADFHQRMHALNSVFYKKVGTN